MNNLIKAAIIFAAAFFVFAGCGREDRSSQIAVMEEMISRGSDPAQEDLWQDLCVFINYLHEKYSQSGSEEERNAANNMIMDLLLVYFNSIESVKHVHITSIRQRDGSSLLDRMLPFLEYDISDDGLLRVYNWRLENDTDIPFNSSIIQYVVNRDEVKAININDLIDKDIGKNLRYGTIFELKDDRYLIFGGTRSEAHSSIYTAIAVKRERNRDGAALVPLPVFNDSNTFGRRVHFGRSFPQKMVIRDSDFDGEGIKFTITYDEVIDDSLEILPDNENDNLQFHALEFVFNGTEFTGDYDRLNEIINSYMID